MAHSSSEPQLSFEFFPPRNESGLDSLDRVAAKLATLAPDFFSCTYGAGGSTREGTRETVRRLIDQGLSVAPHLSIGGDDRDTVFATLDDYRALGVKRIVALRGDLPSGTGRARFVHNAETLVGWIREHSGDYFHLEVAAYPEVHPDGRSPAEDLEYFRRKIAAGADSAITQYFYTPYAYQDFMARCARTGIDVPVVPGIMPITNYEGIIRFSEKCGACW
jgi:methylenetetrahydrofolate reductase (NADPH)